MSPITVADAHPSRVTPGDPRYQALTSGMNQRYRAHPSAVTLVSSADQVRTVAQEAVRAGRRLSVRSGGHCFEDFVHHAGVDEIVDMSCMRGVHYDAEHEAFAVESGARLLGVYEDLYRGWGTTLPGGLCYSVGAGGHVAGGGYGLLSRAHGLIVDHLYAVEVLVVGGNGSAELVVATREESDPNRDLWWAHTGGGGGNFGIVTRYFFRSPEATGALVEPPSEVLLSAVSLSWADLDRADLTALLGDFTAWHAEHSAPGSPHRGGPPHNGLASMLMLNHRANGCVGLLTQVDSSIPDAEKVLRDFLDRITANVRAPVRDMATPVGELRPMPGLNGPRKLPWFQATRLIGTNTSYLTDPTLRAEHKSAYGRGRIPDERISVLYDHLTSSEPSNPNAMLVVMSYGGQINAMSRGCHRVGAAGRALQAAVPVLLAGRAG